MAKKTKSDESVSAKDLKVEKPKPKKQMSRLKMVLLIILAVVVLSFIIFTVGIYGFKWQNKTAYAAAKVVPYPTAMMLDSHFPYVHEVRLSSLWSEMASVKKYYNEFQKLDLTKKENQDQYKKMEYQMQEQLIEGKIVGEYAKIYKVKIDQSKVDDSYKQILDSNGGEAKVKETIDKYYGWTISQLKQKIKEQLVSQEVQKKVTEDDTINADAKKKAEQVVVEVKKPGADFAALAQKYSQDDASKAQGGDLGTFAKGKMTPEFEQAAFALQTGQVSGVVKTQYGYHIIKVESNDGTNVHARHILIKTKSFTDWLSEQKQKDKIWRFYKDVQITQQQSQPQQQQQQQPQQ